MASLVRFDPGRELDTIQSEFNRLFDGFFNTRTGNGSGPRRWIPAMDLAETEDALVLKADLPGLTEDDVEIEVKDNVLSVSGERKAESEEKRKGYHRIERSYGSFSRSLTLPDGVEPDQVKAEFANGVLEVRVPKPEERKPTKIAIGKGTVDGKAKEV